MRMAALPWPGHYHGLEWLSSPLLLTVTHPAMTVTPVLRGSRRQGPENIKQASQNEGGQACEPWQQTLSDPHLQS